MQLELANGWTLSIVPDLHVGFYSVAAWPTSDNSGRDREWHLFEHGGEECRVTDIAGLLEVTEQVNRLEQRK